MTARHGADPALQTLFLPFADGPLAWPADGVLFLRARAGGLLSKDSWPGLVCEQTFKPDAEALERVGFVVNPDVATKFSLILILPPRQRDEARAVFARALTRLKDGGRIVACVANNEGARSSEGDLEQLVGNVNSLSKNKCRVFWSEPLRGDYNAALAEQWRALDAPRPIENGRFVSRPGIFAWDRIDPASALLASHLPAELSGRAADLGCGLGYLAAELVARCPRIATIDLYEAEQRALDIARVNLTSLNSRVEFGYYWHDVTAGLPHQYDVVVTNPPFHTQSRSDRPDIGRRFIAVAAESLHPGGRLWLVANRHLPYESVLNQRFGSVRTVVQSDGFKIIEAIKTQAIKAQANEIRAAR